MKVCGISGFNSDNINDAISESVGGIVVGNEIVRAVVYADDISPVNDNSSATNAALQAIFEAGSFNSYKFKPSKCKIIGSDINMGTKYMLGKKSIERAKCGLLLVAIIDGKGINVSEHVKRRAEMVRTASRLIKSWRTKGLPFQVAYKHLFLAKVVPRFTYAFALVKFKEWDSVHDLIRETLERALCCTFGWSVPKRFKVRPGIWLMICGFPSVFALLRKSKLEMAARLKIADNKAGRIFRNLYMTDRGSFESDVYWSLREWLLLRQWDRLDSDSLPRFKRKVLNVSLKCWPKGLQVNGNITWLYHNHVAFSGKVPMWADWEWPKGKGMEVFQTHFYCLLIGQHPAGGSEACCSRLLCKDKKMGTVYQHHFFECVDHMRNRSFYQKHVRRMYSDSIACGSFEIPQRVVDGILEKPCGMWVGLFDQRLFELGLKLRSLHELYRLTTMASVLSWGRFYSLP